MKTPIRILGNMLAMVLVTVALTSCKKCQQPPEQPFRYLEESPWRLAESTNPKDVGKVTNTNFIILSFIQNGTGDVKRVKDNDQYDTPLYTIQWIADTGQDLLRIKYTKGIANTDAVDPDVPQPAADEGSVVDYSYSIGRELELTETRTGYYYRFVPFTGVVYPDQDCTF